MRVTRVSAMLIGATFITACTGKDLDLGGGTTDDDGGTFADGADPFGEVGSRDSSNGFGCSGDLLHVIDGKGNVVADCPPDQGCYGGTCVPACQAAAQSQSSIGCDFILPTPMWNNDIHGQPCYAVYLANNWDDNLGVTVEYDGAALDPAQFARVGSDDPDPTKWSPIGPSGLGPGQVAVLFISNDPTSGASLGNSLACPISPAVNHDTTIPVDSSYNSQSGYGKPFHIRTTRPVSGYDIIPFGGALSFATSAELLSPTSAWSTNYVVTTSPGYDDPFQTIDPNAPSATGTLGLGYLQVVATQDGTHIQVAVNKDIYTGYMMTQELPAGPGVKAAPAGAVTSYTLNAGQYLQFAGGYHCCFGAGDPLDATGSVISSDKPIGLYSGSTTLFIGQLDGMLGGGIAGYADGERHQLPPVSAAGFEYLAAPFASRRSDLALERATYRLVSYTDGTTFTFDPPIATAPTKLDKSGHLDFVTDQPFIVRSQDKDHPFYLAQMMSGAQMNPDSRPGVSLAIMTKMEGLGAHFLYGVLGDPDFLPLVPPAQFLSHYAFFTDPTYATTNLVITRALGKDGAFKDVSVDCLGNVTGWVPLGSDGRFQYAIVDLVRATVGVGSCVNGAHNATSTAPFGLYVWGTDVDVSYSFAAGGNVAHLNDVVVTPTPN